jgi:Winged helix DNA-binding domain
MARESRSSGPYRRLTRNRTTPASNWRVGTCTSSAPATPAAFARWAGIAPAEATSAFAALERSLTPVRTPLGDAWILSRDETAFHESSGAPAAARFLPSGDAYLLAADRELLVPEAGHRRALWPASNVWPGGLLVGSEVVGTWRRTGQTVTITSWRRATRAMRDAVEAEAERLPLPPACEDPSPSAGTTEMWLNCLYLIHPSTGR